MGDVFKEQLVKKEANNKTSIIKGAIIAGAFLICFVALFFGGKIINALFPIIFLIVVGVAYFLFTMQNMEYEYIYTNGELDIDCITNKSRRKRVFSSDVRAIEIMAHIEDKDYSNEFKNTEKTLDLSSGKIKPNTYVARVSYQEKLIKIIIEPNDTIQQAMATVLTPRKFHVKK